MAQSKIYKSLSVDFKIITRKTKIWEIDYCHDLLHDIKRFMIFGYVETINLVMTDSNHAPLKAKKYILKEVDRVVHDRSGSIDWEDGEGHHIAVVMTHTPSFNSLSPDDKNSFIQSDEMRLPWSPTNYVLDFSSMRIRESKRYTHDNEGVDRIDYN